MAPARKRKATKATRKAPARKPAKKAAKKATRKAPARKVAKKPTKKAAARKPAARKPAAKKAAAPATAARPKIVPLKPRKAGAFSKTDLVDHVQAWNPYLSKKEVKTVVEDTINVLSHAIVDKKIGKVNITGFGSFRAQRIAAKKGGKLVKNPFTGQMVKSKPKPARMKIRYNAAAPMKQI